MSPPELSRPIKARALPAGSLTIESTAEERAALAARFDVTAVKSLTATVSFDKADGTVLADGKLAARVVQPCAVSGEDFAYTIAEQLSLRFVPASAARPYAPDEEIELEKHELDEIEYDGEFFDLGEAIAQSLGLAIDPFREGPEAKAVRKQAGITNDEEQAPRGSLAEALTALNKT